MTLLRRHWQLFRKCWLDSEKLSFLLCGTIHSNWVLCTETYCIWSKWQAGNIGSDGEETSLMSSSSPNFSIASSHAKRLFEAQAVQLQIKNQATFSSGPVSLHSWYHSQFPLLHYLRFKGYLLPRLWLSPLLDLLSQGIIPPCLQSISGFGSVHCHHLSQCSSSRRPIAAQGIPRSQTKTKLYQLAGFVLACKGKFHSWHTGFLWFMFFPLLYQVWFKL